MWSTKTKRIDLELQDKCCCLFDSKVVMLVIAWKLQAETLGFFKFTEWSKGMGNLE